MHFGTLNYAVLATYLIAMLGVGLWFSRKQENAEMFFLGGRKLPWLVVAMSMYASLTSAVTFMAVPGSAFEENIAFILVCVISPIVAPVILLLFYPLYHRLRVTTSYEYIEQRFGHPARLCVAGLFILARLGWLATVIYAPALAMSVVTGIPLWTCVLMMGLLSTAYTALGGLAAVVWTDAIQFVILIGGAIWLAVSLANGVEGGAAEIMAVAKETGRLHIVDWRFDLFAMSGPIVAISFFIQLMQEYGTDQVSVQRLMATGSFKKTVKSVAFNAGVDFLVIALLLFIGLGLFAFFREAGLPKTISGDAVMPHYIIKYLPQGVSGLIITAVFAAAMSSMDSGVNSIATVVINDFTNSVKNEVRLARLLTVILGVAATGLAFYVSTLESILDSFFRIMGLFSAPVLALFLMGVLTRRANFAGWLVGLASAIAASVWIQKFTEIHKIYYIPTSFLAAFGVGLVASRFFKTDPAPKDLTVWHKKP